MSIRTKIFLCLVSALLILWGISALVATRTFSNEFSHLDEQRITRSVVRIIDSISQEESRLASISQAWGTKRENLLSRTETEAYLTAANISLFILFDEENRPSYVYRKTESGAWSLKIAAQDELEFSRLAEMARRDEKSLSGILNTSFGPMMFGVTGSRSLPFQKIAFCGIFLNQDYQRILQERLGMPLELLPIDERTSLLTQSREGNESRIIVSPSTTNPGQLSATGILVDFFNQPVALVRVTEPRTISVAGDRNLRFFLGITAGCGLLVIVLSVTLVEFLMIGRIRRLTRSARHADETGMDDLPPRLCKGRDEIASLARVTKSMVDRLRSSQLLYRAVIETQSELIVRFKPDGEITFVNEAFARFFQRHSKSLIGKNFLDFLPEEIRPAERDALQQMKTGPRTRTSVIQLRNAAGETRSLELNQRAVLNSERQLEEIQAVAHDITERLEYEQKLQKAKEAAESADRAKSEFLAVLGHETRTPLTSVLGFTSILENTPLNEQQKEYVQLIRASGNTLLVMLNDILDYSRMAAGKIQIRQETVNLENLLQEVIATHRTDAEEKGLELRLIKSPAMPDYIETDGTRLRQILHNLLDNGIKFTDTGFVALSVETPSEGKLRFTVKDTGKGIPNDQISRLFRPFSPLDSSTKRSSTGTGIGLAISKRLVELLGGEIHLQSTPEVGSIFSFTIPVGSPHLPSVHVTPGKNAEVTSANGTIPPPSILLVDDNKINQRVATEMLKMLGYPCTVADSGMQCLQLLRQRSFDIIFLDVQMPGMDGFETSQRIRTETKNWIKPPYIVACTAFTLPGDREKCEEAGMDDFVAKPLKRDTMQEVIDRYFSKYSG